MSRNKIDWFGVVVIMCAAELYIDFWPANNPTADHWLWVAFLVVDVAIVLAWVFRWKRIRRFG